MFGLTLSFPCLSLYCRAVSWAEVNDAAGADEGGLEEACEAFAGLGGIAAPPPWDDPFSFAGLSGAACGRDVTSSFHSVRKSASKIISSAM